MRLLLRASAGLLLWGFGFALLYAMHGLGCAREGEGAALIGFTLFRASLIGTWLLLAAAGAAVIWWARRSPPGLERRLALASAVTGLVATIVTGMPVAATSVCV
ncbi:hypothetical protein [Sphingomonas hengshuiensis]|uniref:hypothetical protein n=1 Tax=Sphingomonas hengshuiensis TaxID=1609977 RepID=UPI0006991702|nr:hypothetical protein [Sphingomonas hengshuiensis]